MRFNPFKINLETVNQDGILFQQVQDKIDYCVALANERFNLSFPAPIATFNLHGLVAGQARYYSTHSKCEIRINPDYLRAHTPDMIEDTVPHEVAHLIAFAVHGKNIKSHGYEWQDIAIFLGCTGNRCHSYDAIPAKKTRKFLYLCPCGDHHYLGLNLHRKVQTGDVRVCMTCNRSIEFKKEVLLS